MPQINHAVSGVQGNHIKLFLEGELADLGIEKEERGPELELGFGALRRTWARRIAEKYNINLGNADAMTDIVPILDAAWNQGQFPKPRMPEDRLTDEVTKRVIEQLKGDPVALRALLAQAEASSFGEPEEKESPLKAVVAAEEAAADDPFPEQAAQDEKPAGPMEKYLGMDWHPLRTEAAKRGIDVHAKGMGRDRIIDELVALDAK